MVKGVKYRTPVVRFFFNMPIRFLQHEDKRNLLRRPFYTEDRFVLFLRAANFHETDDDWIDEIATTWWTAWDLVKIACAELLLDQQLVFVVMYVDTTDNDTSTPSFNGFAKSTRKLATVTSSTDSRFHALLLEISSQENGTNTNSLTWAWAPVYL